jgi:pyruvate dehydrogenase E2 component (dihydrolipoamide acetyltransferase)
MELTAPVKGVVKELFQEDNAELDMTGGETKIFSVGPSLGGGMQRTKSADRRAAEKAAREEAEAHAKKMQKQKTKSVHGANEPTKVVPLNRFQEAFAKNMSVQIGVTTLPFNLIDTVNFDQIKAFAKSENVSPTAVLVKYMGEAAKAEGYNQKLDSNRKNMEHFEHRVDIGCAVDAKGQLRVAVVRDVDKKSLQEIHADMIRFSEAGARLSAADQDTSTVCWTVSSMGKSASEVVLPVLPPHTTGILGVGRIEDGKSKMTLSVCHATLSGMEGGKVMSKFRELLNNL